jgi:hypothetical protein
MGNYAQNATHKRMGYDIDPKESWAQFLYSRLYLHVKAVIGEAAEDLAWSLKYATTGQKLEMWQAWEEYFVK